MPLPGDSIQCSNCHRWLRGAFRDVLFVWNDSGPAPGVYAYRETKYVDWFLGNDHLLDYAVCSHDCAEDRAATLNGKPRQRTTERSRSPAPLGIAGRPADHECESDFDDFGDFDGFGDYDEFSDDLDGYGGFPGMFGDEDEFLDGCGHGMPMTLLAAMNAGPGSHFFTRYGTYKNHDPDPEIVVRARAGDLQGVRRLVAEAKVGPYSAESSSASAAGSSGDEDSASDTDGTDAFFESGGLSEVGQTWDPVRVGKKGAELCVIRHVESIIDTWGLHEVDVTDLVEDLQEEGLSRKEVEKALGMKLQAFLQDRQKRADRLGLAEYSGCRGLRQRLRKKQEREQAIAPPRIVTMSARPPASAVSRAEVARQAKLQWPGTHGDAAVLVTVNGINVEGMDDDKLRQTVDAASLPLQFEFRIASPDSHQDRTPAAEDDEKAYQAAERKRHRRIAQLVNSARRWTEVQEKYGYDKSWEWFGDTALIAASRQGHPDVVRYLLEELADPTLEGCPSDDVYEDAMKAAQGNGLGRQLVRRLLDAAKPFWKDAPYKSSHYDRKRRAKMENSPTDAAGLRAALDAVVITDAELSAVRPVSTIPQAMPGPSRLPEGMREFEHRAGAKSRRNGEGRCKRSRARAALAASHPVCCYWLQGRCRFGYDCRFAHEGAFSGPGQCQFGLGCRLGH